jgi:hypothetical protein
VPVNIAIGLSLSFAARRQSLAAVSSLRSNGLTPSIA